MRVRPWMRVWAGVLAMSLLGFAPNAAAATVVRVHTVLGSFDVELFDKVTPLTVQNFLSYATDGDWNGTFFHRSEPGFVVQTGGFHIDGGFIAAIPADPPVPNEFKVSSTRGTLAMAKQGGDPDSATNQWFVNLADNSENLDNQNGGFTVFGRVLGDGMGVVDAIAALTRVNLGGALDKLPVKDFSLEDTVMITNLVFIHSIEVISSGCEAGQRSAAAKFCKAAFSCLSKFAKTPAKDPTLARLDACKDKAELKFVSSYQKAVATAAKKAEFCAADDPGAAAGLAETWVSTPAESIGKDVLDVADLASWTSIDKADNTQRSGLLKAAATYCGKDLGLFAKEAKKPNRDKIETALSANRAKFDASAAKILAKAAAAGAAYPGRPVDEVGDLLEDITEEVAGTITVENALPVLDPVGDQAADTGSLLTFTATASDPDLPAQNLTFSLFGEPAGASIDPVSGAFTWTPDTANIFEIVVVVTDDGPGLLSDAETIRVTVTDP